MVLPDDQPRRQEDEQPLPNTPGDPPEGINEPVSQSGNDDDVRRALREALNTNPFGPAIRLPGPKQEAKKEDQAEKRLKTQQRLLEILDPRNFRELTVEDLPAIGKLYESREMPTTMFDHIGRGEYNEADDCARRSGGYVDRWRPTRFEEEVLRQLCSNYEPSSVEFERFLRGLHGRQADFRAFGIFDPQSNDLRSVCAMFVPPRDPVKREAHGQEVRRMFLGQDPVRQCTTIPFKRTYDPEMQSRAETTAEFYLIGSYPHGAEGAANVSFHRTIERLREEGADITDFYLLHYDGFDLIKPEPTASERPKMNAPNPSHNFGTSLGFWPFAMCKLTDQMAARTTKSYGVVVVQPIWQCMWAENYEVREHDKAIMQQIEARATK